MGTINTCKKSGELVDFMTPSITSIKSLKVYFSPKQNGSGYPSPNNIRPFKNQQSVIGYHDNKILKWNQLAEPLTSEYYKVQNTNYSTLTFNDGEAVSTIIKDEIETYQGDVMPKTMLSLTAGHVMYVRQEIYSSTDDEYVISIGKELAIQQVNANEWTVIHGQAKLSSTEIANAFWGRPRTKKVVGDVIKSRNLILVDLTKMYGYGNEPTLEEFELQCVLNGINLSESQVYTVETKRGWIMSDTKQIPYSFNILGKNLCYCGADNIVQSISSDYQNFILKDGIVTTTGGVLMGFIIPCKPNTTYTASFESNYLGFCMDMRIWGKETIPTSGNFGDLIINKNNTISETFTTLNNINYLVFGIYAYSSAAKEGIVIKNFQIEESNTVTAYESCIVQGKEFIYDHIEYPFVDDYYVNAFDGSEGVPTKKNTYSSMTKFLPCHELAGLCIYTPYCCSGSNPGFAFYDENKHFISGAKCDGHSVNQPLYAIVPSNTYYLKYTVSMAHNNDSTIYISPIYGGYIDLITGELKTEWGVEQLYGLFVSKNSSGLQAWHNFNGRMVNALGIKNDSVNKIYAYCDTFKETSQSGDNSLLAMDQSLSVLWTSMLDGTLRFKTQEYCELTASEFKTTFGNSKFVYKLANPVSHYIPKTNILQTFLHNNYIWSNVDFVEIEYNLVESAEIRECKRRVYANIPHKEFKSGEIINFKTDIKGFLKTFKNEFLPIDIGIDDQNINNIHQINGWNEINIIKSKKNLFEIASYTEGITWYRRGYNLQPIVNTTTGEVTITGVGNGESQFVRLQNFKPGTYTFSFNMTLSGNSERYTPEKRMVIKCYDSNNNILTSDNLTIAGYIYNQWYKGFYGQPGTFTVPDIVDHFQLSVGVGADTSGNTYKFSNIQLEYGTVQTDYEVNTNEKISFSFGPSGKNLYDITTYPLTKNRWVHGGQGSVSGNGSNFASTLDFIPFTEHAGKTITLNKRPSGSNPGVAFYSKPENAGYISGVKNNNGIEGDPLTFTVPIGTNYIRFTVPATATDIQLELGDTATEYEAYIKRTIYGGYVNIITGELVQEWDIVDLGNLNYENKNTNLSGVDRFPARITSYGYTAITEIPHCYCTAFKPMDIYDINNNYLTWCVGTIENRFFFCVPEGLYNETSDFITAMTGQKLIYKLAEPIVYQLTPQQIKTFIGQNNIWSDANNVEVKYWTH